MAINHASMFEVHAIVASVSLSMIDLRRDEIGRLRRLSSWPLRECIRQGHHV